MTSCVFLPASISMSELIFEGHAEEKIKTNTRSEEKDV